MTLQEKILYCRKKQGLSQEALAEKIGVSRQAISKWETGEATPEVGKLSLLAKTFHVTVDWLLSEEEPEETTTTANAANNNHSGDGNSDFLFGKRGYQNEKGIFEKIKRMIVKYSWIAGVYIALAGLLIVGVGFGGRVMFHSMFNIATDQMNNMSEMMTMYTEYPEVKYNESDKQDLEEFQKEAGKFFPEAVEDINTEDSDSTKDLGNIGNVNSMISGFHSIINGFTLVIIIVGAVMMLAGIVLAVYLKVKANKKKETE